LKAVLELVQPGDPPTDEAQQLDLIGAEKPEEFAARIERRGPGRPPGARNKRTQEWAEFLLARNASPLEVLMQIANARVDDLARQLGCKRLEALQEKRLAAIALVPYLHQKMPLAVDLTNRNVVYLTINETSELQPSDGDLTLTATVVKAIDDKSES
jgi:hypothetical protein